MQTSELHLHSSSPCIDIDFTKDVGIYIDVYCKLSFLLFFYNLFVCVIICMINEVLMAHLIGEDVLPPSIAVVAARMSVCAYDA